MIIASICLLSYLLILCMNLDTNVYLAMPLFDDGQPVSFLFFISMIGRLCLGVLLECVVQMSDLLVLDC